MQEYRLLTVENNMSDIRAHVSEVQTTMAAMVESIKTINQSLEKITEASAKLLDRINILELDLSLREEKKRFYKSLISFYPIVITILIIVLNVDHKKISEVTEDVSKVVNAATSISTLKNILPGVSPGN